MLFNYLSKEDVEAIHESTLEILETIGVRSTSKRFLEVCAKVGLKVEDGTVYFPRDLVAVAIKSVPAQFSLYSRNGKREAKLGSGEVYSQTCIGSPFILDIKTGARRPVLYQDLQDFTRVCDGLDHIDIISAIFPKDTPKHAAVTSEVVAQVKNTSKPLHICIESDHEMKYIPQVLAAAVGGMDNLLKKPTAYLQVSPISPLDYAEGPANGLVDTVEAGLPLGIIPCCMTGATSPMTLIGSVTMHNAEMLAGVVVAQLMKPGHPCVMSPRVTTIDMRTAVGLWTAPEMGLAGTCSHQMALYYGVPSEPTGFSGASKVSDEQSGFERMFNALVPGLAGASILGTAGTIDNALIADYRTIVMDNEISSLVKRAVRGEKVDKDIMAVEAIREVVNGERNFLGHEHTIRYLRTELWKPELCERDSFEGWNAHGKTYHDRAMEKALDLYNNHVTDPLPEEYVKAVDAAYKDAVDKK